MCIDNAVGGMKPQDTASGNSLFDLNCNPRKLGDASMASPDWSALPPEHNLSKFAAELSALLDSSGHDEMYGVKLEAPKEG